MSKPILCLDFDGVLHSYASGWKGAREIPDPPVLGAMAFLVAALGQFEVAIHSSRARYWGGRSAMKEWLIDHMMGHFWEKYGRSEMGDCGFTAVDVDETLRSEVGSLISRISFPRWKPAAFVTLDDRSVTFTGEWPDLTALLAFKPWNKGK
jgi:hypothetical protein